VAKAADDRLAADMAHELREHNVAAVSLYPGLVRTEGVMAAAQFFDLSNSESPQFTGRAVAALAADPEVMKKRASAGGSGVGIGISIHRHRRQQPLPLPYRMRNDKLW
jgi:NAD(P)-dependent dehydrogenase (short-subunit alcohol dehydrogenase family)